MPGARIGILGSGQLGRMTAMAAKHMGYSVHVLSESGGSPTGQVCDIEVCAELHDLAAIERFASGVDVVTVETENIPVASCQVAASHAVFTPGVMAMQVSQDRALEKQFLSDNQLPTCRFRVIHSDEELRLGWDEIGPSVLKTTRGGYDGKGQIVLSSAEALENAWQTLGADEAILEQWIDYDFEFSVIGARTNDGQFAAYAPICNEHQNQILDVSTSPSPLTPNQSEAAIGLVKSLMDRLDAVGVLTVEFFFADGEMLVNEIAPRPHNSGHLTIEAHQTSQFEQHVRAVCGLPLGATGQLRPAAMANLLGELWDGGTPNWQGVFSNHSTKLHLYGKAEPRLARKMGHITALADSVNAARQVVVQSRERLVMVPNPVQA